MHFLRFPFSVCQWPADDGILRRWAVAVQERVSVLEGKVGDLSQVFEATQAQLAAFEQRVDRRFEAVQAQSQAFEERVDRRFEATHAQTQARFDGVDRRLDTIDAKLSRQFMWLVGLVITTQAAIMTALIAFLAR